MKSKFYTTIIIAACCILNGLHAQTNTFPSTGNAGIGTTSPLASAALEMKSTSKGLLIPRMTKAQRDAVLVSTTAKGLLIYQTNSTPGFYYYNGSAWKAVSSLSGANTSLSNLTATSVNQSLIPSSNNAVDIGSSVKSWRNAYLAGTLTAMSVTATSTAPAAAISGTGLHWGVYGFSQDSVGVVGASNGTINSYGVIGTSPYNIGVYGIGGNIGVFGQSSDGMLAFMDE